MFFSWMKQHHLNWHQAIAQFTMRRRALWLLLAVMATFVLVTHQSVPMIDRDEARFSQASRQMAETGDVITIRFLDELRAKKPAGIYWLQAGSASLFSLDLIRDERRPARSRWQAQAARVASDRTLATSCASDLSTSANCWRLSSSSPAKAKASPWRAR